MRCIFYIACFFFTMSFLEEPDEGGFEFHVNQDVYYTDPNQYLIYPTS
jgi:hypothetical protein